MISQAITAAVAPEAPNRTRHQNCRRLQADSTNRADITG